jgi:hypothetical protein
MVPVVVGRFWYIWIGHAWIGNSVFACVFGSSVFSLVPLPVFILVFLVFACLWSSLGFRCSALYGTAG